MALSELRNRIAKHCLEGDNFFGTIASEVDGSGPFRVFMLASEYLKLLHPGRCRRAVGIRRERRMDGESRGKRG